MIDVDFRDDFELNYSEHKQFAACYVICGHYNVIKSDCKSG